MKTRKLKTRKLRKLVKCDVIVILICLLYGFFRMVELDKLNSNYLILKAFLESASIFGIIFLLFIVAKNIFYIWIIYIPIRFALKKRIEKNIRYEVINNIEYYRDKFPDLSPAEISIISDLDVETEKDIAATILKLYGKKYIDFENEKLVIKNNDLTGLNKSEQEILLQISDNKLSVLERVKWKECAFLEANNHEYIKLNKNFNKKKHFWISTLLILFAIYCVITSTLDIVKVTPEEMDQLELYNQQEISKFNEEELLKNLENNADKESYEDLLEIFNVYMKGPYGKYIIDIFSIIINNFLIFALIVYKVFRAITYRSIEQNKYVRTEKGTKLAEEIAAMQRYIHEFSLLSEKEKEDIMLWDDFLVYAIILEENTSIVKEIFRFKNTDYNKFDGLAKINKN